MMAAETTWVSSGVGWGAVARGMRLKKVWLCVSYIHYIVV
jgi:hypothetical protein